MAEEQKIIYENDTVTFKCPCCHATVTEPYNEELAIAEFERLHGEKFEREKLSLVCDPCHVKLLAMNGINRTMQ